MQPHPPRAPYNHAPQGPSPHAPAPKKKRPTLIIVMVVLVVLMGGAFVAYDLTRSFGSHETSISVEVKGPYVEVRVSPRGGRFQPGESVRIEDRLVTCNAEHYCSELSAKLPAEAFEVGRPSLSVMVQQGDDREEATKEFDLSASAHDPWLAVTCGAQKPGTPPGPAAARIKIDGFIRSDTFKRLPKENPLGNCPSFGSAGFNLNLSANMDAEVTVDGEAVELDEGRGYFSVPVVELLGQLVVKDGTIDTKQGAVRKLVVSVKRSGKEEVKHTLVVAIDPGSPVRMAAFAALKTAAAQKQMPWPSEGSKDSRNYYAFFSDEVEVSDDGKKRKLSARRQTTIAAPDGTPFRAVTRIAVGTPTDPKPTSCHGYQATDGGPTVTKVILFQSAMEVVAYDGDGQESNRRTFARPTKKECPTHVAGKRDVSLQGPSLAQIGGWLRTLR